MSKMKIYYAAPLFTEASQDYNRKVVDILRKELKNVEIYLPQENEALNDKSGYADSLIIANGDNSYLLDADLVIAHIDGQEIDAGVASEIGISWYKKTPILGLYTDVRQSGLHYNPKKIEALEEVAENQYDYKNLYTIGLIKDSNKHQKHSGIARTIDELVLFASDKLFSYEFSNYIKLEGQNVQNFKTVDGKTEHLDSSDIIEMLNELDRDTMIASISFKYNKERYEYTYCTVKEILSDIPITK